MPAMQQPEAYIGGADKLFDEEGNLTNDSTRDFLQKFLRGIRSVDRAQRSEGLMRHAQMP